ncbi:response regulator [Leptospira congkakensis]|uniref:Response regulator n=1 Tax=Leptospira congkakensis TaxID=2484932 RepID=A0A4Z1A3C5_9LEPT|nr:response regulator [Leptospira congkakensis]TGL95493.1 response regulator [Leptospira congkakensis]TGL96577.1 response regulator [Leptospira congkakensis]
MSSQAIPLLASEKTGKDWMDSVLPILWEGLCTELGFSAGVVVLKAEEEDSFYESASFGYGEDGFYYSFLNRGSEHWEELMHSPEPVFFSGTEFELFGKKTNAFAIRISSQKFEIGFLLAELEEANTLPFGIFLSLFADKIGNEWGKTKPNLGIRESIREGNSHSLYHKEIPNLELAQREFANQKILTILGPAGSGKKTLAKWIHQSHLPGAPFLVVESLPDHFGKLEKALSNWGSESKQGSLVLTGIQSLNLGQQQILSDWWSKSGYSGSLFLLGSEETSQELLPEFERFLRKNSLVLPSLRFLPKAKLLDLVQAIFEELCSSQNRSGLQLGDQSLQELVSRAYAENFTDLRNAILTGILTCRTNQVEPADLEPGKSRMDLEIPDAEDLDLRRGTEALERQKILLAMRIFSGNQIRMAKALGISRGSLQYKMKQLGLM